MPPVTGPGQDGPYLTVPKEMVDRLLSSVENVAKMAGAVQRIEEGIAAERVERQKIEKTLYGDGGSNPGLVSNVRDNSRVIKVLMLIGTILVGLLVTDFYNANKQKGDHGSNKVSSG